MAKIKLTRETFAIIDDEDFEKVNQYTWNCLKIGYAQNNNKTRQYMHRFILNNPKGNVDHINGNKLDNRKVNLRVTNQSGNMANSGKRKTNTSGFKVVFWDKRARRYIVNLTKNYKHIYGGTYFTAKDAAIGYNKLAIKHFGEYAKLNII